MFVSFFCVRVISAIVKKFFNTGFLTVICYGTRVRYFFRFLCIDFLDFGMIACVNIPLICYQCSFSFHSLSLSCSNIFDQCFPTNGPIISLFVDVFNKSYINSNDKFNQNYVRDLVDHKVYNKFTLKVI